MNLLVHSNSGVLLELWQYELKPCSKLSCPINPGVCGHHVIPGEESNMGGCDTSHIIALYVIDYKDCYALTTNAQGALGFDGTSTAFKQQSKSGNRDVAVDPMFSPQRPHRLGHPYIYAP